MPSKEHKDAVVEAATRLPHGPGTSRNSIVETPEGGRITDMLDDGRRVRIWEKSGKEHEMIRKALVGVALIATLNHTTTGAEFSAFFPLTPGTHGTKTFAWTYGRSGTFTSVIGENETVSYGDGTHITGAYITNSSDIGDMLSSNVASGIQFLGTRDAYLAADPNLDHPPAAWLWGPFTDGYYLDQGTTYLLRKSDLAIVDVFDQSLLFDLQHGPVTVLAGAYEDVLVLWYLDKNYPYVTPDFDGRQENLGISPPTSAETSGYSLTAFEIYTPGVGLIASGGVEAVDGKIDDLYELVPEPATLSLLALGALTLMSRRCSYRRLEPSRRCGK